MYIRFSDNKDMHNTYNLQRFVVAQESCYNQVLAELKNGRKCGHWIWFIFPQQKGLGRSYHSKFYGLDGSDEAKAYLEHPLLGARLRECCRVLMSHIGKKAAEEIMGSRIDVLKLKTSMELFDTVSSNDIFADVLNSYFKCCLDKSN